MNLADYQRSLTVQFDRDWQDFAARLPMLLQRGQTAWHAVEGLAGRFGQYCCVDSSAIRRILAPHAELVDRATMEKDARLVSGQSQYDTHVFDILDLANVLECVGDSISPTTLDTFRRWLPLIRASRDDYNTSGFWSRGFAALALDERHTYSKYLTPEYRKTPVPFDAPPDARFGFNLQGLLTHLAGAVEQRAPFERVAVAWDDWLAHAPHAMDSRSINPGTLLWIARVVHHRIACHPLGEVAQRLHDDIWRLA